MNKTGKFVRTLLFLGLLLGAAGCGNSDATPTSGKADGCLFCFWNVENLFDDQVDHRANVADKKFDAWFANDPEVLRMKLANLSSALLQMNEGKGPDILALAEVESLRAAELLADALNAKLPDTALHYTNILMKDPKGGRHIATAILTRLPVRKDKTQLHGNRLRILEGHIVVDGHDLVVIASHWTSRLTDTNGDHRSKYADQIHGVYRAMVRSNPAVDFLVCGDFNDPPEATSVTKHLHATDDRQAVLRSSDPPLLLDLMAGKNPAEFGSHYYHGWMIFDQIAVSPGMLDDRGWSCDPDSIRTFNSLYRPKDKLKRPWAFGKESDRQEHGYSDHFPVTVRLHVGGS